MTENLTFKGENGGHLPIIEYRLNLEINEYSAVIVTVQATKRLYPSRLRTWNFASHVTFLRGFCEEVAWVLCGISVSFAKFCENFFVERGKQA